MTMAECLAIRAAQNNTKASEDILQHYRSANSRNWEEMQQNKIRKLFERNKNQW